MILIIVLISTSITQIQSTEVGVEYLTVVPYLNPNILIEGLNIHTPFSSIIIWPIIYQTIQFNGEKNITCNSQDGLEVVMDVSFQYIPKYEKIYELTSLYETFQKYAELVEVVARSSIRHVCSDFTVDAFQSNRSQVHEQMETQIINDMIKIHSDIVELQLRNIERPRLYENAVQVAEDARNQINLAKSEKEQKITEVITKLEISKINSEKIINKAKIEADVINQTAEFNSNLLKNWYNTKQIHYSKLKDEYSFSVSELLTYIKNQLFNSPQKMVVHEPSTAGFN